LRLLGEPGVYGRLETLAARLADGLAAAAREAGVAYTTNRVGSMLTGFFCAGPVTDYASAKQADTRRYAAFFQMLLERGVYFAPSQFEAGFVSLAHTEADIDATLAAAELAFRG
jgi:glutamate-1-semialdehyde 2,1-aminomutase